ncbi:uncharacterized protein LOC115514198 [Lynx canadensis]|uniref:uncharacterized protein LOC115514198 n=1 Tax=Lynx canadensis TaxID=61383 RepID=UPI0011B0CA7B|nr:uncharacterized protein LOC115514198 [Lynx canadensis]
MRPEHQGAGGPPRPDGAHLVAPGACASLRTSPGHSSQDIQSLLGSVHQRANLGQVSEPGFCSTLPSTNSRLLLRPRGYRKNRITRHARFWNRISSFNDTVQTVFVSHRHLSTAGFSGRSWGESILWLLCTEVKGCDLPGTMSNGARCPRVPRSEPSAASGPGRLEREGALRCEAREPAAGARPTSLVWDSSVHRCRFPVLLISSLWTPPWKPGLHPGPPSGGGRSIRE